MFLFLTKLIVFPLQSYFEIWTWTPRLLVLGDFNVHARAEASGSALEFLETMASLNMSQHVNGPTHVAGHTLDLVFSTNGSESGLMVTDLESVPLSWSDHHLMKCTLKMALPPLAGSRDLLSWSALEGYWIRLDSRMP